MDKRQKRKDKRRTLRERQERKDERHALRKKTKSENNNLPYQGRNEIRETIIYPIG